jgi:hypothetical protein
MILKCFHGADDRAVRVVNRDSANPHWNLVPVFVMQEGESIYGLGSFHGARRWAIFFAEFAARLIAVQQSFTDAAMANNFVAGVTRNAFGPSTPHHDFFLQVDNAQPSGEIFEDAATNLGIVESRHGVCGDFPRIALIGRNSQSLK